MLHLKSRSGNKYNKVTRKEKKKSILARTAGATPLKAKPRALRIPSDKESIVTFFEVMERAQKYNKTREQHKLGNHRDYQYKNQSRTPPNDGKIAAAANEIHRPSAPPPPSRLLEGVMEDDFTKKLKDERRSYRSGRSRKATKSMVTKKSIHRSATCRVKTAPANPSTKGLRFPTLNLTPKSDKCNSPIHQGRGVKGRTTVDTSVQKACIRLIKMRSQQIVRTLKQLVKSEEAQNKHLSLINKRKSSIWKRLVKLEKVQQAVTTCMITHGSKADISRVIEPLCQSDRQKLLEIIAKYEPKDQRLLGGIPSIARIQIWGEFYDEVVLPQVVEHRREDANRLRSWKKLAPTVNMRMHLKSIVSLLEHMQEKVLRLRYGKPTDSKFLSPAKLKKYLDECAPVPFVDREFIDAYL
eukprot:jgi/Bigna1/79616/fgenesh1_pg.63_\